MGACKEVDEAYRNRYQKVCLDLHQSPKRVSATAILLGLETSISMVDKRQPDFRE